MSVALENFDRNKDRSDPQRAARLFELLWADPAVQAACADRLAKSIRHAHGQADASWEVTMFTDRIRLNVGQVEVLILSSDEIAVLFRAPFKTRVDKRFSIDLDPANPIYQAVPVTSGKCRFAPADLRAVPGTLWTAHESFIGAAAEAKSVSPFKKYFSDGVLRHVEALLGSDLPRPSYIATSDGNRAADDWRNGGHLTIHGVCVCAIRHGDALDEDWRQGGSFSFTEGRSWTRAAKELNLAKLRGSVLPIVFADARDMRRVIFTAQIDDVRLLSGDGKAQTTITASRLEKLASPPPKTQLVVADTGRRIPSSHIRSYVICRTPRWIYSREVVSLDAPPEMLELPEPTTEGCKRLVQHLIRERNRALIERKKYAVLKSTGCLACEVCGFDFRDHYGNLGDGFCEVHHRVPLSAAILEVQTNLEDLAVVCSNCHRMIHRGGEVRELSAIRAALGLTRGHEKVSGVFS